MQTRSSYYETTDLALAAALLSMDIPFCEEIPFAKIKTPNGEQYKFFFQERSRDNQFSTGDMVKNWNNDQFYKENPDHPLAYLKCFTINRNGLLDAIKQSTEFVVIEKNGKLAIISKNASKDLQDKIFSQM